MTARAIGIPKGILLTTDSACAPVTSSDGLNQIATFNASANLIIGDAGGGSEFDYLVVAGGGGGGAGHPSSGAAGSARTGGTGRSAAG